MPTQIILYPGTFTSADLTDELYAVLEGLLLRPGKVSEALMSSIRVDIYQENLRDLETGPFLLVEGFVDFAKRFHERFRDFVYFASHTNRFYLDVVLAISTNITVVRQGGEECLVPNNPDLFLEKVDSEIARFERFCVERTDAGSAARADHADELISYLDVQ